MKSQRLTPDFPLSSLLGEYRYMMHGGVTKDKIFDNAYAKRKNKRNRHREQFNKKLGLAIAREYFEIILDQMIEDHRYIELPGGMYRMKIVRLVPSHYPVILFLYDKNKLNRFTVPYIVIKKSMRKKLNEFIANGHDYYYTQNDLNFNVR